MPYKKKELLSLSKDLGPPLAFSGISIAPSFQSSVLCFLCLFVFVLCLVYNIAAMSGLSILIVPSDFFNIYFQ
jgi:hypothetical protein